MKKPLPLSLAPRGLTVEQAAEYAGIPVATFRRAASAAGLRPLLIGGKRRFDRKDIDQTFFDATDEKPAAATATHWLEASRK